LSKLRAEFLDSLGALHTKLFSELITQPDSQAMQESPLRYAPGDQFGAFALGELIGKGGMSEVFLAHRVHGGFDQQVALKLIAPGVHTQQAEQLFVRERAHLASLSHPNIARLIDGGQAEDGTLWFAMEYIEGSLISEQLQRSPPVSLDQRLTWFLQLCDALQHAHSKLLVHRDIKRSNILIRSDQQLVLLDFGIAGNLQDDAPDTFRGAMTPHIAAPEQLRGDPLNTATDIFQLGLLLQDLQVRLPPALRAISDKAISAKPADRYPSVDALRADVVRYQQGYPVQAMAPSKWRNFVLVLKRNRAAFAAAAIGVLALATTVIGFTHNLQQARLRAEQEASSASAVTAFLVQMLEQASPNLQQGKRISAQELIGLGRDQLRTLEKQQPPQRELQLRLSLLLGQLYNEYEDYQAATPLLERALALHQQLQLTVLSSAVEGARIESSLAVALSNQGAHKARAEALFAKALATLAKQAPGSHAHRQALRAGAWFEVQRGNVRAAAERTQAALSEVQKDAAPDPNEVLRLQLNLGQMLGSLGEHARAQPLLNQACRDSRSLLPKAHPITINACGAFALLLTAQQQYAEAKAVLMDVRADIAAVYGDQNVHAAHGENALAWLFLKQGQVAEAKAYATRASEMYLALPSENDSNSVGALEILARAELALGDTKAASATIARMWARGRDGAHAMDPDHGQRSLISAQIWAKAGDCARAREFAEKAQSLARAQKVPAIAEQAAALQCPSP
jgi:eukaryotic-like serine/threonine-protein kinase